LQKTIESLYAKQQRASPLKQQKLQSLLIVCPKRGSALNGNRRGSFEIIFQVLNLCRQGKGKTGIMYQTNLSYKQCKKYVDDLLSCRLIWLNEGKYVTTLKGKRFFELYSQISEVLENSTQ
jgi:predicted transcriptional regulator